MIWLISNKFPIKNQPYKPLKQKSSTIINLPIDENNDIKLNITWDKKDTNIGKSQLVNPIREISFGFKTDQDNTLVYKIKGISSKTKSYTEKISTQFSLLGHL